MKSRGKSTPFAELIVVVGVLLPVSACTWANPWKSWGGASPATAESEKSEEFAKKRKATVELTREQQSLFDRYHPPAESSRKLGLNPESRDIEDRLGVK